MSESVTPGGIIFNEIPYTWKVPGQYMEVKAAINENAVLPFPAHLAVMGQMYATGVQATPGVAYPIYNGAQADALFGRGSQLAKMCRRAIKANPYTPIDAIGIADATGSTKAAGAIAVAGTATAAGTHALYFGGVRVAVGVSAGDTPAVQAANIYAALQQQAMPGFESLPSLTPSYTSGSSVALTCAHGGTLGNQIDIRTNAQRGDMTPAGVTVTITPLAGGATDPTTSIATALSGISAWYTDVVFAWTDTTNTGVFSNWLIGRYGAMVKLDVQGYVVTSGTYGTLLTYAPNCKYLSVLPVQNPLSPSWETAASYGAACCYSTAQKPSLQMKTVPLPGIVAPAAADQFTIQEQEVLLNAGFSTYYVDSTGTVYLQRVTTSYRTDPGGIPNTSWFDLQSTKVPTRVRYDWDNYIGELYPRNNLTNDGTVAAAYDPDAVTPGMLKASWAGRSAVYEQNGWIQNSAVTAANSSFTIDPNDGNRVNARQQIQIMGNLIVLAGSLEFISNN
jgi:phage tail sheath gpL-like